MRPDEPRVFSTYVRDFTLVAQERVLVDGEETGVCLVLFLRAAPGRRLQAHDLAAAPAAPWAAATRLVWNEVECERPPGYEYDAIVEVWYASVDAVATAFGGKPVWAHLPGNLSEKIDVAHSVCMLTHVTHRRP